MHASKAISDFMVLSNKMECGAKLPLAMGSGDTFWGKLEVPPTAAAAAAAATAAADAGGKREGKGAVLGNG